MPNFTVNSNYVTPTLTNTRVEISSITDTFKPGTGIAHDIIQSNEGNPSIKIIAPDGTPTIIASDITSSGSYIFKQSGVYRIKYSFYFYSNSLVGQSGPYQGNATFTIAVVPNYDPLPKWNIRGVIERVLNLAEPHTVNVEPQFKLDPAQAVEFEKIESPEFAFTGLTLKGILDQIGGFIHGEIGRAHV